MAWRHDDYQICKRVMVIVRNFSGDYVGLTVDGTTYQIPAGKTELAVSTGDDFTIDFSGAGGGGPPPPPSGNQFTEYGTLEIFDSSFEFTSTESPAYYFAEGMGLGVLVFGTALIIRLVRSVARQSPCE